MHMFNMSTSFKIVKYWINSAKAVVGVDQPMKALSMHIQKPYLGKIVLIAVILSKHFFESNSSMQCVYMVKTKH